ncbi:MAG: glutamate--cysteine ligase [Nodosilinea sp.]
MRSPHALLTKGFEVELFTGTPDGEVVGLARSIAHSLVGFVCEPDHRNIEYVTPPLRDYGDLRIALLEPRWRLRQYLHQGDYTLLPGSTLSLGGSDRFERSDPTNPYHAYIERIYGAKVVTTGIHLNIGIADPEALLRVWRVIRLEAALFLALSAASPFLNGVAIGWHSTRWGIFPQTPAHIPLFASHGDYVCWTEAQLAAGTMQNVRHLWLSVRPNGDRRPYDLNRLELRILDLVTDPAALLAMTALLELRIQVILQDETVDPLGRSPFTPPELIEIAQTNDLAAARHSLNAQLIHWQTGQVLTARTWVWKLYGAYQTSADQLGISAYLRPLLTILDQGNAAQRWLADYRRGQSPRAILTAATQDFALQDLAEWCSPVAR